MPHDACHRVCEPHPHASSLPRNSWPKQMNSILLLFSFVLFRFCCYVLWVCLFDFVLVFFCITFSLVLIFILGFFFFERERDEVVCLGKWGGFGRSQRRENMIKIYCIKIVSKKVKRQGHQPTEMKTVS